MIPLLDPATPAGQITINALGSILASAATEAFQRSARALGRRNAPNGAMTEQSFLDVRAALRSQRTLLARIAYHLPAHQGFRALGESVPVLMPPSDLLADPLPIPYGDPASTSAGRSLRSVLASAIPAGAGPRQVLDATLEFLPRGPGGRLQDYVDAIRLIENPEERFFHDLPSYRFHRSTDDASGRELTFSRSSYFDYLRTGEVLCFELAWRLHEALVAHPRLAEGSKVESLHRLLVPSLRARTAARLDDGQLSRHSVAGVNVLLVVHDATDNHRFFMMQRGGQLASAMGTHHVIPAGEFQPSATSPDIVRDECNPWFTFLREFAEELLLYPRAETHNATAYSFETERPFATLDREVRAGNVRLWYLGHGFDPLSLKTELMCAAVVREDALGRILRQSHAPASDGRVPERNSEGEIMAGRDRRGIPFVEKEIRTYRDDDRTLPAGSGCLHLAWLHRARLLAMD